MLGGWKITCTTLLPWADKGSNRKRCFTALVSLRHRAFSLKFTKGHSCSTGLQNFTYPRTDAVVIMIAIDETGDKILLGRNVSLYTSISIRKFSKTKYYKYRKGILEGFILLYQVSLNLANLSRMLWEEKCGKKPVFASGMSSIILDNLG